MEDDMWRADGSFRALASGGRGGKGGSGPQFNRVIPKFLQKFHQGPRDPSVETKFAPAPQPPGEEDGDAADELDDVQKAAIDEYLKKEKEKDEKEDTANLENVENAGDAKKPKKQKVASLGKSDSAKEKDSGKKRKRKDVKALSNKKLLSFSMDDDDA